MAEPFHFGGFKRLTGGSYSGISKKWFPMPIKYTYVSDTKKGSYDFRNYLISFWYRERDLNSQGVATGGFWVRCVYQFHHPGVLKLSYATTSSHGQVENGPSPSFPAKNSAFQHIHGPALASYRILWHNDRVFVHLFPQLWGIICSSLWVQKRSFFRLQYSS